MTSKRTVITTVAEDSAGSTGVTRRKLLTGATASAIAGTALASAGILVATNSGAKAEGGPIPIGSAVPLTGWAAADGIEYKRGVELACKEINALGGILGRPLEPHFEDTKTMGAENVIPAIQRLVDHHSVHAIICGYNGGTGTAEYDVVADEGIMYLHHNTSIEHHHTVAKNPAKYFGIYMSDPAEYWYGEGLLAFLKNLEASGKFKPQNKKLALVQGADNYGIIIGSGIKEKAAQYGWQISMVESVSPPISEWGPTISKIRQDPPGVIAFTHWVPQDLAQFMIQFTPNPTNSLVYMQYGPSIAAFREIAKESSEGVIYSSVAQSLQDEMGLAFMKRYRTEYGEAASPLNGALPYDSTYNYALAAALAGGTGEPGNFDQNRKVAARLKRLIFRGVMGTTRFFDVEQAAIPYPDAVNDPSLGMPHQYAQIQKWKVDAMVIAPSPYETSEFMTPPWMKS